MVPEVDMAKFPFVINYNPPSKQDYVQRVGSTGAAKRVAFTIVNDEAASRIEEIESEYKIVLKDERDCPRNTE
ncbi:hypothetical protein LTR09_009543 [Extremus antarcticus]|uniref:Uncharacterized protein n=1 Tax=Extremus antarcticus TaxID=702011 RepID=A0AAJ0G948_9PEZI|nr:hypothetical protein LTR09_009543 [Extremus antarcticus]